MVTQQVMTCFLHEFMMACCCRTVSGVAAWACPFVALRAWWAKSASKSPGLVANVIFWVSVSGEDSRPSHITPPKSQIGGRQRPPVYGQGWRRSPLRIRPSYPPIEGTQAHQSMMRIIVEFQQVRSEISV